MNCSGCSAAVPDGARFCPQCGAALEARPAAARVDERKVVTVLFCDLVGSTALSGRIDPEALRSVTLRYFELMTERIEAHGGTVEKFIGDAVMAVFGIPVLHEDDARRAAAAALDMLSALAVLNRELAPLEVSLNVRIGVNTGEAVATSDASTRQALVSGEVVNVAARLEQNAAPGEILIGPDTLASIGPAAVTEPAGALALKGKTDRVAAHRLRELLGDAPELLRRFDTPFVGRRAERAHLDRLLTDAAANPRPATVLGEAGLGKTRLTREWLAGLGPGTVRVGAGRCRPYGGGGSLAPLGEAVAELLRGGLRAAGDSLAVLEAGLLLDGTPNPSVEETCAALLALLAGAGPAVVVLDDFHWAGPLLRDSAARLAAGLADRPVLLLCLARPELLEHGPEWADGALTLGGLSAAESARLAAGLVEVAGHGAVGLPLPERLLERAEGNPLHLEQLLAMVSEGRSPEELPSTVQALLGARIDGLEPPERTTLGLASVVGREFPVADVAGLAGHGPEGAAGGDLDPGPAGLDRVRPALHRLGRRRLVEPARQPDAYRFSSGLVQEVSYRSTAKRVRADRHERTADLLAARGAPDSRIGGHLAEAYRYRTELGLLDPHTEDLRRRAAERLTAAGAQAAARADLSWAAELLEAATALYREDEPERLTACWRLGEVRLSTGRTAEGRQLLHQVLPAPDPVLAAHARLALAVLDPGPDLGRAAAAAEAVLPLFQAAGDELGQARACLRTAQAEQLRGRHAEAQRLLDRALTHAVRADAEPERATALGAVGVSLWLGPLPADRAAERCRELLAEHGPGRRAVRLTLNCPLAVLLALQDRPAEARQCLAEAERLAGELGYAEARVFLPVFRAAVAALADRPDRAAELLREAEAVCTELGATAMLGAVRRDLARSLLDAGDPAAAHHLLAAPPGRLSPSDAADHCGTLARTTAALGCTSAEPGGSAEALAVRALAEAEPTDSPVVRATAALDAARTALALGAHGRARRLAAEAERLFAAKGHPVGVRWARAVARTTAAGTSPAPTTGQERSR